MVPQNNIFYVIATPLGHLGDLSYRAREVLASLDFIACEDTRVTSVLLNHYGIRIPCLSYRDHNAQRATAQILERLQQGQIGGLVSDAGTPLCSDPGAHLVEALWQAGIPLRPLPGPCAAVAALSVSPLAQTAFQFIGFLPAKGQVRSEAIVALLKKTELTILYEAVHRMDDLLAQLAHHAPQRRIHIGREITKLHEQHVFGTSAELYAQIGKTIPLKGEFVVILEGATPLAEQAAIPLAQQTIPEASVEAWMAILRAQGLGLKHIAAVLAKMSHLSKNALYQMMLSENDDMHE